MRTDDFFRPAEIFDTAEQHLTKKEQRIRSQSENEKKQA
jgi:hypothetical protein